MSGRCLRRLACAIKGGRSPGSRFAKFADFAALADVDANVLTDNVAKAEKRQQKKPDAYNDYRKVLDRKDIEAVMIAMPDHWHTKIAIEAMHAGNDVYREKPLTLTIDEGKTHRKGGQADGPRLSSRHDAAHRVEPAFPVGDCARDEMAASAR